MSGRLEGKVALITGAGSGMGRVAAALFAAEGARVVVTDVVEDAGNDDGRRGPRRGRRRHVRARRRRRVGRLRGDGAAAVDTYGALHVLYNNAGIFPADDGGVLDTPEATWRARHGRSTSKGVWLGCKAGIPAMLDVGRRVRSSTSRRSSRSMGAATAQIAYTASKGGVLSMTREIAVEYARQGIRANALCPGPIETPLLEELLSDPARRARRMVHIPMGRLGRAEELAKAALFLASDDASFMTGAALVVDGGITAAYVTPE